MAPYEFPYGYPQYLQCFSLKSHPLTLEESDTTPEHKCFIRPSQLSLTAIWIVDLSATFKTTNLACAFTTSGQNIINKTLMSACTVEDGCAAFFLRVLKYLDVHGHLHFLEYFSFSR
jgi:hypothetical protein